MNLICDLPALRSDSHDEQERVSEILKVCVISLGDERIFVELRHVREVFKLDSITPVPGMPTMLIGVANLRGTIVPLVDLKTMGNVSTPASQPYVVVIQSQKQYVGIVIDQVPEIRTLTTEDRVQPPMQTSMEHHPYLSGFYKSEHHIGGMLEVSRLLESVEGAMSQQPIARQDQC